MHLLLGLRVIGHGAMPSNPFDCLSVRPAATQIKLLYFVLRSTKHMVSSSSSCTRPSLGDSPANARAFILKALTQSSS